MNKITRQPDSDYSVSEKIVGLSIVAVVALLAGTLVLNTTESTIASLESSSQMAASSNSKKPEKNNAGNIWEALKQLGLQGEHYTLNIHGKSDKFNKNDCTVIPDPETGMYGNNIFIPSNGDSSDNNQLIMTSGNSKGKWADTGDTAYGVRDACTAPFDGDAAELTLPPNPDGYYVTARVLGKPTNNPEIAIDGELLFVEDEVGNDLLILGLVTDNGFETPTQTLTRTKGKTKATDISGLFEWTGQVCYFEPENYCYDDADEYTCTEAQLCCEDGNLDGITDSCIDPIIADDLSLSCEIGTLIDLACQDYLNEWVFNIGDMVGYMWNLDASGDFKLANIRFYPIK